MFAYMICVIPLPVLLVNKGVSLYEVQTLLGHSSMQMTQRYAHLAPDLLHSRTELVSSIINGQRI
jgi:hypothetical protein